MGNYKIGTKSPLAITGDSNIPVLIDWLLSDEGQTLIEQTGYVRIK